MQSDVLQKEAVFGLFDEAGAAVSLARRLRSLAKPYKNWPSQDRARAVKSLDAFSKALAEYVGLSRKAGIDLPDPPDVRQLRRRLVTSPDRLDAMRAFTLKRELEDHTSRLWAYVSRVASDEVAESIDEAMASTERRRVRRERMERRRTETPPPRAERKPSEPEWTPYFHSTDPDVKKKHMSKSKGQMTEDLVGAIEANRGTLPPDLQATIPNLVRFVRMRGGVRVAGLMENVYEARKGDISRLMWLFFGARQEDASDFINSVLWQMEDTWNREDFPSVDPKPAAKPEPAPVEPGPAAPPAPAGEIQVAPAAEPVPAVAPVVAPVPAAQPEAPKKGLGPAGLMPQPAMPTTIIEKGTEPIPSVKPTEERPKPRVLKPDLFRQFKKPRLGR